MNKLVLLLTYTQNVMYVLYTGLKVLHLMNKMNLPAPFCQQPLVRIVQL